MQFVFVFVFACGMQMHNCLHTGRKNFCGFFKNKKGWKPQWQEGSEALGQAEQEAGTWPWLCWWLWLHGMGSVRCGLEVVAPHQCAVLSQWVAIAVEKMLSFLPSCKGRLENVTWAVPWMANLQVMAAEVGRVLHCFGSCRATLWAFYLSPSHCAPRQFLKLHIKVSKSALE